MGAVRAPTQTRPKIGFVLSGGGSRGAYEAGIIHYLRTDLAKRLGRHVPIDIVTGTSVGAINAAFLAATMSDPATAGRADRRGVALAADRGADRPPGRATCCAARR